MFWKLKSLYQEHSLGRFWTSLEGRSSPWLVFDGSQNSTFHSLKPYFPSCLYFSINLVQNIALVIISLFSFLFFINLLNFPGQAQACNLLVSACQSAEITSEHHHTCCSLLLNIYIVSLLLLGIVVSNIAVLTESENFTI